MGNEIIIDGVNVAGCLFLTECGTYHFCCGNDIRESDLPFANYCKENANCYYKQLKRLEQENKNLRKVMWDNKCPHYVLGECSHGHHENCYGMAKCIEDLEQERDELQKQCVKYAQINEQETKDYAELLHENENQKKTIAELLEACNKCDEYNEAKYQLDVLENTLKNIRCLLSDAIDPEITNAEQMYNNLYEIQNKINEVLK